MTSRYKPGGRDVEQSADQPASPRVPLWPLVVGNVGLFVVVALLLPVALAIVAYLLGTAVMVLLTAVLAQGVVR